ncbi:MAG: radical SAM protein [Deltaproteobacteria bacterium]|nr:radical SAM protein [Deltaproteobacteria bacterium]
MKMVISIEKILENKCVEKCIPFYVQFELTYRCNLSCRHCYIAHNKEKELTFKEVTSILDQLVEMRTFYLCFTGGEIFTRKDFLDIAWYAKEKGFSLILLTNGTLITDKEINELRKIAPLGIEISLLGARAETHDFITKTPGSFNKAVSAIKELSGQGVMVTIKTTLMKKNVMEYQEIKSLCQGLGVHVKSGAEIIPRMDGRNDAQGYQISWEDRLKYLGQDESSDCQVKDMAEYRSLVCKAGKAVASISPCGDIQPCILMPIRLGNLKENTFREIWYPENNSILSEIRSMTDSDLKICFECKLAGFCTRCPGTTYLETGDLLAPSPIACEQARWRAYCHENFSLSPARQFEI